MPTTTQTKPETKEIKKEALPQVPLEEKVKKPFPFLSVLAPIFLLLVLSGGILLGMALRPESPEPAPAAQTATEEDSGLPSWITGAVITLDGESRSGEKLEAVRDIAVHYVANPGTSAMANRNYFDGPDSSTSSHFIVGLEGEILLCVPLDEKSCATGERNPDTISVEVCHPDETGEFSEKTRESLIRLLAWLCEKYDLTEENLIRHYDVTGKMCPLYYVENPAEWEKMKSDVAGKMQEVEE